jgi:hypothetical protein
MDNETIARLGFEAGAESVGFFTLKKFAELVAAHEREAIERVVGVAMLGADHELTKRVLGAIRARGNT